MRRLPSIGVAAAFISLSAAEAEAIPRSEIVAAAPSFEDHDWYCGPENLTAWCADGTWDPAVTSAGPQVGLPYCWGGWVTVAQFDQQIADGYGAGSLPDGLFLDCTTGVDCSGYVSQLWQHPHKLGTATIPDVSVEVATTELLPGDVFNDANHHVIMFLGLDSDGTVIVTESTNASACMGVCRRSRPWSAFDGYVPRAYVYADMESSTEPGTLAEPIPIDAFPYKDWRNTEDAVSDVFDFYSTAPDTNESGPEYLYVFHVASGGTLTASVADAAGVDVDIHLLSSASADACLVREDTDITYEITTPGTYYLVADTYVGSSGTEYTGAYMLTADFDGELEQPSPEAGPEPMPEPALEAGVDATTWPVDAGTEGGPSTRPSSTYEGDSAEGCACSVPRPKNRGFDTFAGAFLAVLLLFWRRRAGS